MALTPTQVGSLVDRMQIVGNLFQPMLQLLSVYENPDASPIKKQVVRHSIGYLGAAALAVLSEPVADPTKQPYTANQVAAISDGFSTFMACQSRILRDIALAQQDGLLGEGNDGYSNTRVFPN